MTVSHYHVLLSNLNTFYESYLEQKKIATNVFEFDSFRITNEIKCDHAANERRENPLLSTFHEERYEDFLITNPEERNKVYLKTHVLFVDFIRKSYEYTLSDKSKRCGKYTRDDRINYGENRYICDDINEDHLLPDDSLSLSNLVKIQEIPFQLQMHDLSEITNEMTLLHSLTLIRANIKSMKKIGLSNSEFIVYIVTYYIFLQEVTKVYDRLSRDEYQLLTDLVDEIEILYLSVQVNVSNTKLYTENAHLKLQNASITEKKDTYQYVLNRFDKIDILFLNGDTNEENDVFLRHVLREIEFEFTLAMENNVFILHVVNPNELLSLYKILYEYHLNNKNVFVPLFIVKPDGYKVDSQDMGSHTIEAKSSIWSYVFYKLYGPRVKFTKEKDETVKSIIKLSQTNGIPLHLLLPKSNA